MTSTELKAKMYDLLASKQQIEIEMQRVNQAIVEALKIEENNKTIKKEKEPIN